MASAASVVGVARLERAVAHFCLKERWVEAWDHRDWAQGKIGWLPQWRDALDDQVDHEDLSRLAVIRQARDAIDDYLAAPTAVRLLIADNKVGSKLAVASVRNDGRGSADGHHQLLHLAALGKGSGAGTVLVGEVMREAGKAGRGLIVTVAPGTHGYFVGKLGLSAGGGRVFASEQACLEVAETMRPVMHPDWARPRYVDFISGIGRGPWECEL